MTSQVAQKVEVKKTQESSKEKVVVKRPFVNVNPMSKDWGQTSKYRNYFGV